MAASKLNVKGIAIAEFQKPDVIEAVKRDIVASGGLEVLAKELGYNVKIYKKTYNILGKGQTQSITKSDFSAEPDQVIAGGNNKEVILLYNETNNCYEFLKSAGPSSYIRTGGGKPMADSVHYSMLRASGETDVNAEKKRKTSMETVKNKVMGKKDQGGNVIIAGMTDDDVLNHMKNEDRIIGDNEQKVLDAIVEEKVQSIAHIKKIMKHLKAEYHEVSGNPPCPTPKVGSFKAKYDSVINKGYAPNFSLGGAGKKMEDCDQAELDNVYKEIQKKRAEIITKVYNDELDKVIKKDVYSDKLLKDGGDDDFKAMMLSRELSHRTALDDLTTDYKFMRCLDLIPTKDPVALKKKYALCSGESRDSKLLSQHLEQAFSKDALKDSTTGKAIRLLEKVKGLSSKLFNTDAHKFQFAHLNTLLEGQDLKPIGRLAGKLGLFNRVLVGGKLKKEDREEAMKLIKGDPELLTELADPQAREKHKDDTFFIGCLDKLQKKYYAEFDEIKNKYALEKAEDDVVEQTESKDLDVTAPSTAGDQPRVTDNPDANYLISIIYKARPKKTGAAAAQQAAQQAVTGEEQTGFRTVKKKDLQDKMIKWIKTASEEDRKQCIAALRQGAKNFKSDRNLTKEQADAKLKTLKSFEKFAFIYNRAGSTFIQSLKPKKHTLSDNFINHLERMGDIQTQDEKIRPVLEAMSLIDYQKGRRKHNKVFNFTAYEQRKETKAKLMNLLSSSDDWDAMSAIHEYAKYNVPSQYHGDPLPWLEKRIKEAGVSLDDAQYVSRMVRLGGSHNGDVATDPDRNLDNYLKLKDISENAYLNKLESKDVLTILMKVKQGSFEYDTIRKDARLLQAMQGVVRMNGSGTDDIVAWRTVYNFLDIDFENQDAWLMDPNTHKPYLDSEPEVYDKARVQKVKSESGGYKKKKAIASKFAMIRVKGTQQSIINVSNKRELLAAIMEAQAEGVKGSELREMLQETDPNFTQNLSLNATDLSNLWQGEAAAYQLIRKYMIEGQKIGLSEFLSVIEGHTSDNYNAADFLISGKISGDKLMELACPESVAKIKKLSRDRLRKKTELLGATADTPPDENAINQLKQQLKKLDDAIKEIDFGKEMDAALKTKIDSGVLPKKYARELRRQIGQAMVYDNEKVRKTLSIPQVEAARLGSNMLSKAEYEERKYIRSGFGFHQFSSAGMGANLDLSNFTMAMVSLATYEDDPNLSAEENKKKKDDLNTKLKKYHKAVGESFTTWKATQDRYNEKILNVVDKVLTVAIGAAIAATPLAVAAGPVVVALLKNGMSGIVKNSLKAALSRKEDINPFQLIKEVINKTVTSATIDAVLPGVTTAMEADPLFSKDILKNLGKSGFKVAMTEAIEATTETFCSFGSQHTDVSTQGFVNLFDKKRKKHLSIDNQKMYKTIITDISGGAQSTTQDMVREAYFGRAEVTDEEASEDLLYTNGIEAVHNMAYNKLFSKKKIDKYATDLARAGAAIIKEDVVAPANPIEKQKEEEKEVRSAVISTLQMLGMPADADFDYDNTDTLADQVANKLYPDSEQESDPTKEQERLAAKAKVKADLKKSIQKANGEITQINEKAGEKAEKDFKEYEESYANAESANAFERKMRSPRTSPGISSSQFDDEDHNSNIGRSMQQALIPESTRRKEEKDQREDEYMRKKRQNSYRRRQMAS